jgi:hypothetical protein
VIPSRNPAIIPATVLATLPSDVAGVSTASAHGIVLVNGADSLVDHFTLGIGGSTVGVVTMTGANTFTVSGLPVGEYALVACFDIAESLWIDGPSLTYSSGADTDMGTIDFLLGWPSA